MAAVISELDPSREGSDRAVEQIVRLERRIFPKHESLARSFYVELKKKNGGLMYARLENGKRRGGEEEEIIGYVMYSWVTSLCASITKLAVKDSHRKKGHGETLLKEAIEKCRQRKIHRISLHVDPTRTPAVSLYKKLGFQIDCLVESYYSPERNAYRMYLDFDNNC